MFVVVTRTMASVGSWIVGSGAPATRTSCCPCQTTAFIGELPLVVALSVVNDLPGVMERKRRRLERRSRSARVVHLGQSVDRRRDALVAGLQLQREVERVVTRLVQVAAV